MPKAELLSIGTELLLGQILNTNTQFLSGELASLGIDCLFHVTVGDNPERIIQCLRQAFDRSDIIITTGGLGPTADDLTHECIAKLFEVDMDFDQATLDQIRAFFERRGIVMADSNKKQALRPHGSDILFNNFGTAPGIIWKVQGALLEKIGSKNPQQARFLFTFPGVPSEMQGMWQEGASPFLSKNFGPGIVWSQDLKHYGIGESLLAEKYSALLDGSNPTVAPLAGTGECRLRVTAKADSKENAEKIALPIIEKIKSESGHLCYGIDKETLESVVAQLLIKQKLKVSLAESCTGGLISTRLTDIPGSSAYTELNLVTYSDEAKQSLLKVKNSTLNEHGAVSYECAKEMVLGLSELSKADINLAITGIAGPGGGSTEKPVGLVYIALESKQKVFVSRRLYPGQLNRNAIRFRSASDAINMIRLLLIDPLSLEKDYASAI